MDSKKSGKKEYSTPKLISHGEAKKLTWGTSGSRGDGGAGHSRGA
ncbi:hypothetical protein [Methanobacterium sp.]